MAFLSPATDFMTTKVDEVISDVTAVLSDPFSFMPVSCVKASLVPDPASLEMTFISAFSRHPVRSTVRRNAANMTTIFFMYPAPLL